MITPIPGQRYRDRRINEIDASVELVRREAEIRGLDWAVGVRPDGKTIVLYRSDGQYRNVPLNMVWPVRVRVQS